MSRVVYWDPLPPPKPKAPHRNCPDCGELQANTDHPAGCKAAAATVTLPDEPRVVCVAVTRPECPGKCIYSISLFSAIDEFAGAEEGEEIVLMLCSMTEQEFKDLPDFEGW